MTPKQALDVLSQATDPRVVGKMTRGDYCACEQALAVLGAMVKEAEEQKEKDDGKKASG